MSYQIFLNFKSVTLAKSLVGGMGILLFIEMEGIDFLVPSTCRPPMVEGMSYSPGPTGLRKDGRRLTVRVETWDLLAL